MKSVWFLIFSSTFCECWWKVCSSRPSPRRHGRNDCRYRLVLFHRKSQEFELPTRNFQSNRIKIQTFSRFVTKNPRYKQTQIHPPGASSVRAYRRHGRDTACGMLATWCWPFRRAAVAYHGNIDAQFWDAPRAESRREIRRFWRTQKLEIWMEGGEDDDAQERAWKSWMRGDGISIWSEVSLQFVASLFARHPRQIRWWLHGMRWYMLSAAVPRPHRVFARSSMPLHEYAL